ncbi:MAG TPA: HAD-IA family hydrolase [Candidatus Binatia bacterium]|nr:HAD-IA family hydrolase [Candidatus Binatia bacterium]
MTDRRSGESTPDRAFDGPAGPDDRPPAVLILDLDRTLVDVEPFVDYCGALAELRRIFPDETVASVDRAWGSCTRTAMALLAARSADPAWPRASAAIERYELEGIERSRPMPGLAEFVGRIDPERTAVVTLLTDRGAERTLARHGVPRPAVIVGRRAGLRPKPSPDPLLAALRDLGAPPAAVMVGDSEVDEAAARAAGVRFVGLTNGRAEHGFGAGTLVVRDLAEATTALMRLGVLGRS